MANFKHIDTSQGLFLTVNLQKQLVEGTFEWTLDYLIDKTNIALFEKNYNNDITGAAAYSPKVLLKIILFCYSRGIITSRKIERACRENITTKALAGDSEPDHATIAAFISGNSEAVKDLFVQVLLQCSELDLITGEMFAGDGCKLPSNASKEWSGKIADLQKKRDKLKGYIAHLINQHTELDKSEEAKKKQKPFEKTMGDDKERRKSAVEKLEKKLEKLNGFLEDAKERKGVSGEEVKSNITDNESAFIKSPHGYIQGYNGITISDSGNQIIISAEAVGCGPESGSFPKMLDSLEENMEKVTGKKKPLEKSLFVGDTGFFTEENLQEADGRKIEVLIPDPQFRQRDPYFAEKKEEKVKKQKTYTAEDFVYNKKGDCFICPAGEELHYTGDAGLRNNTGRRYQAKSNVCVNCALLNECIKQRKPKAPEPAGGIKKKRKKSSPVRTLYIAYQKYEENLSEKMRAKIDDPAYRELYFRRMQIIEPVFSNITYNKGMDRFTMRGEKKVDAQWKLYCIVHNIGKCAGALLKKLAG